MNGDDVVLIVNADDYGLTDGTNRGVERAHSLGTVSSTSVMVNQGASAEAAGLPMRCPELGIGLHLALTDGEPISDPAQIRSLTDVEGQLLTRSQLLERLRDGSLMAEDVVRECSAQLRRLRSLGIEPDHWNVHQHITEYVPIGAWVASAMADGGVRVARNPLRLPIAPRRSPKRMLAALQARRRRAGCQAISALHRTPDALLDAHPTAWAALVPSLPRGLLEAVCHPAERDWRSARVGPGMASHRYEELRALIGEDLRCALASRGVALATFAAAFTD